MGTFNHVIVKIEDDDLLYRRVRTDYIKQDGTISKSAFITNSKPDNEISLDLARYSTPERTSQGPRGQMAVIQLVARLPRSLGFYVHHDPLPNASNPNIDNYAHTLAEGENTKGLCDSLAAGSGCIFPVSMRRAP